MSKKTKQPKKPSQAQDQNQAEPNFERVGNLAKDALDPKRGVAQEDIEAQIGQLDPEEAAVLLSILEITFKRRRIQMLGYICALLTVIFGMVLALYMWSKREPGEFIAWVFMLPPAAGALSIWLFGRWSSRVK